MCYIWGRVTTCLGRSSMIFTHTIFQRYWTSARPLVLDLFLVLFRNNLLEPAADSNNTVLRLVKSQVINKTRQMLLQWSVHPVFYSNALLFFVFSFHFSLPPSTYGSPRALCPKAVIAPKSNFADASRYYAYMCIQNVVYFWDYTSLFLACFVRSTERLHSHMPVV